MSTRPNAQNLSLTLASLAANCLKMPVSSIARSVPLTRYGLDSFATIELTAAIEQAIGRRLSDSLLVEHPDIDSLARHLTTFDEGDTSRVDCREQMRTDSRLPSEIRPPAHIGDSPSRGAVLITGVTGFLGGYLLRSLLQNTCSTVFCLARGSAAENAAARIYHSLQTYGIWDAAMSSRLKIIEGDLDLPRLGLGEEQYANLCDGVDAIYHAAAAVNWIRPYAAIRGTNVLGTCELLRIACTSRTKPFHFVSTASVCYSTWGPREVSEADDVYPYLNGLYLGYAQSKCVAESLVRQASERGLPATIHRPSLIAGDRASGVSNADDLLSRLIKGMIQMEAAPDLDWSLDCCPVDYVADAIVYLTTRQRALGVSHILNPAPRHWRELILWMNLFGYRVRLLPYREWLGRLKQEAVVPGHPLRDLLPFFSREPEGEGGLTLPELYEDSRRSQVCTVHTREAMRSSQVGSPNLDSRLLDRYFLNYIARGFLPPVRRKPRRSPGPGDKNPTDAGLFTTLLRIYHGEEALEVRDVRAVTDGSAHSIISELSSWKHSSPAGLNRYLLQVARAGGVLESIAVVVKRKAKDKHLIDIAQRIAGLCSAQLGHAFVRFGHSIGLTASHFREIGIYEQKDERFKQHVPTLYGSLRDDQRGEWALVLEDITGLELLDSSGDVAGWRNDCIEAAILGLADLHAIWFEHEKELRAQPWLGPVISPHRRVGMRDLWLSLAENAEDSFSRSIGTSIKTLQRRLITEIEPRWHCMNRLPRTLIHNDFNPRNVALRREGERLRLCCYDWELATLGVPQHDLAEFLCFVLKPSTDRSEVLHYLDLHRSALERASNRPIDPVAWNTGFRLSLHDLLIDRFALYAMIDRFRPQRFLTRVVSTWHALYELFPIEEDRLL